MIEFKKYEGAATLESLGTVKEIVGKGKLQFIGKNLKNTKKRVVLLITNEKGESATISCSTAVSDALREKKMTVGNLLGLQVLENEEGVPFVSMPAGAGSLIEVDLKKTKVVEFEPEEAIVDHNELIAW